MNKYTLYQKQSLNQFQKNIFKITLLFLSLVLFRSLEAQEIDILLKGGHVIDPKNKIDTVMDIAITGNKISQVARNIPANNAKKVIDVTGLYVTPGIIDMHVHVFNGTDVQLTCTATGSPSPNITWFKSKFVFSWIFEIQKFRLESFLCQLPFLNDF